MILDILHSWKELFEPYGTLWNRQISWTFPSLTLGNLMRGTYAPKHVSKLMYQITSNLNIEYTQFPVFFMQFPCPCPCHSLSISIYFLLHLFSPFCISSLLFSSLLTSYHFRHYGALQGLDKQETVDKYGKDQVNVWRR